ncbi:MAG: diguanylate cyclase [bacterium]
MPEKKENLILIIDDNPDDRMMFSRYLKQAGFVVETTGDYVDGISIASKKEIDCILLDSQMPKISGIEVLKRLKADVQLKFIPVIMLTGLEEEKHVLEGLDSGADDYLGKSSSSEIIVARVRAAIRVKKLQDELKEVNKIKTKALEDLDKLMAELKEISIRDSLTKLYNHGYFRDALCKEFHRAKRYGQNMTCLMLDIDYFKRVNDTYGHLFGDKVLVEIADCIKKCIRGSDILARYGGEEFSVLLIESDYEKSFIVSEKIRNCIESCEFKGNNISVKLTVSIGLSSLLEDAVLDKEKFLGSADLALYSAKMGGRNNVVMYKDIESNNVLEDMRIKHIEDKIFGVEEISKQSYLESIKTLITTHEQKDPFTREHSLNVLRYALMIAEEMRLPKNEIAIVSNAAILHDLGKIGISDTIVFKKDKLTEYEYSTMKRHSAIAFNILRKSSYVRRELDIILHHHEQFDGKGYPSGLEGKNIPLGARIITVADSYDAMRSHRSYRKDISQEAIIDILVEGAGIQFDPEIVCAFFNGLNKNGLWPSGMDIKQKLERLQKKIIFYLDK